MKTCQNARKRRYFGRMSIAAEKVAEVLALPEQDRAFLARQLIASLDDIVDADAETQWQEVIDRRSREMAEGRVDARPEEEVIRDIRAKLHARHPTS
jgi:putative addiction module component (TIGR02574 family)